MVRMTPAFFFLNTIVNTSQLSILIHTCFRWSNMHIGTYKCIYIYIRTYTLLLYMYMWILCIYIYMCICYIFVYVYVYLCYICVQYTYNYIYAYRSTCIHHECIFTALSPWQAAPKWLACGSSLEHSNPFRSLLWTRLDGSKKMKFRVSECLNISALRFVALRPAETFTFSKTEHTNDTFLGWKKPSKVSDSFWSLWRTPGCQPAPRKHIFQLTQFQGGYQQNGYIYTPQRHRPKDIL